MKTWTLVVLFVGIPSLGVATAYFALNSGEGSQPLLSESEKCPLDYRPVATISLGKKEGYGALYGIAVNSITNKVYAAHSGNGTVAVIDGSSDSLIKTIMLEPEIKSLEVISVNTVTNKIYVASSYGQRLWVIDGSVDKVITSIPVGKYAIGVAVDESNNKIYVASNGDDTVSVIDGVTDTKIAVLSVPSWPRFVTANSIDNKVYVSNFRDSTVAVIDGNADKVTKTIPLKNSPNAGAGGIVVNAATNKVYVASSGITVISGTSETVMYNITLGRYVAAFHITANPISNEIFAASGNTPGKLIIMDGNTDSIIKTIDVGNTPMGVAVNPVTNKVYVANTNDGTVSVVQKNDICV